MDKGVIVRDAVYTGNGWCIMHQLKKEPEQSCIMFYCSNLPPLKANKDWKEQKWAEKKLKGYLKKNKYKSKVVKTKSKEK